MQRRQIADKRIDFPLCPFRVSASPWKSPSFFPVASSVRYCARYVLWMSSISFQKLAGVACQRDKKNLPTNSVIKGFFAESKLPCSLPDYTDFPVRAIPKPVPIGIWVPD